MAEFKLGRALQFLVITISVCVLLGIGFGAGVTHTKYEQSESDVKVLNNDSIEGYEITKETQERKNAINEWLKNNDPYDDDGNPTPEWLQLMESEKSNAEQRGDQTSIIRKFTKL